MSELESLFKKYNVATGMSYLARVQTLISRHKLQYDTILELYNKETSK